MEILSKLTKYRDLFGILTQKDRDGGDSLQRTSSLYSILGALKTEQDDRGKSTKDGFLYDLDKLRDAPGRYVRHPNGTFDGNRWNRWYRNPNNTTRDQMIVTEAAMVINNTPELLKDVISARSERAFFHFNTEKYDDNEPIKRKLPDPPSPIEFALFIRGTRKWYLYPLLLLLDLELFGFLIIRKFSERARYDGGNMYLPILLACLSKYKTPLGILAKCIYSKTNDIEYIKAYYSEEKGRNGLAPLGELYEYAFNKLIKGQ